MSTGGMSKRAIGAKRADWSEQCGESDFVSDASERVSGRANNPVHYVSIISYFHP